MDTYRHFFDIDPDYFPAVNPDVIRKNPELWKKFFPHETFVKLVKDVVNVLTRKQKLNLWVEGAYGTGKSHAVLTLKHLLDADERGSQLHQHLLALTGLEAAIQRAAKHPDEQVYFDDDMIQSLYNEPFDE